MTGRILITGASGYLGSHLTDLLLKKGWDTWVISTQSSSQYFISKGIDKNKIISRETSSFLEQISRSKFDAIIHTATCYGRKNENFPYIKNVNFDYPRNILNVAIQEGCHYFINVDTPLPSNCNAYTNTKNLFSAHLLKI